MNPIDDDSAFAAVRRAAQDLASEPVPEVDWAAAEARLLAALPPPPVRVLRPASTLRRAVAFAAVAAVFALGIGLRGRATDTLPTSATAPRDPGAVSIPAELAAHAGPRDVASGDEHLVVTLPEVGRVTFAPGSRASLSERTTHAPARPGVLPSAAATCPTHEIKLAQGSVRSEVTPVPRGGEASVTPLCEPLAILVDGTRVAVHGTVFTVTRLADRVVVDVERGTVSVGPVSRSGGSAGRVLVGPVRASFSLDGATSARFVARGEVVSAAPALQPMEPTASTSSPPSPPSPPAPAPAAVRRPPPDVPAADHEEPVAAAEPPAARVAPGSTDPIATPPGARGPDAVPPPIAPPAPSWLTEAGMRQGLARCFAATYGAQARVVSFSVISTFTVRVAADGSVQSARFDPPLKPEFQQCAGGLIAGRFERGPAVLSIPVAFRIE